MIVIPAVDLRGGKCVRLREGRPDTETVFGDDPIAVACRWAEAGAGRLHIVDLDAAFAGAPKHTVLIGEIVAAVAPVEVEVGGGLRDVPAVATVLAAGARWAIVGTRAVQEPAFLDELCRRYPGRIIVAVDGRGPMVAINGWTELAAQTVVDVASRAADAGAAAVLYTDVSRDGTERGPNVEDTTRLAAAVTVPVLASGGVARLDDLRRLATIPGVAGAVVGRALYTGALDLGAAIEAIEGRSATSGALTREPRPR